MKLNKNIEDFTIAKWSVVSTSKYGYTSEYFCKTRKEARSIKNRCKKSKGTNIQIFKNDVLVDGYGMKVINKTLSH